MANQAALDAARSTALHDSYGEQSTFWFHRLGQGRAPAPPIRQVLDPATGNTYGDDTTAGATRGADVIADHFDGARPGGLFAVRQTDAVAAAALLADVDRRLTPAQAAACDGPITAAELRTALQSMPRGSAPGSDGLPFEFYTTFWGDDMAQALLAVMNDPFLSASAAPHYCSSLRMGVLTLLHKGKDTPLTHINSYRPITLLNSDYKIAAKVIALRFAAALETVVDVTQTAFVPGRWIGDNILLHQAILDHLNPDPGAATGGAGAGAAGGGGGAAGGGGGGGGGGQGGGGGGRSGP